MLRIFAFVAAISLLSGTFASAKEGSPDPAREEVTLSMVEIMNLAIVDKFTYSFAGSRPKLEKVQFGAFEVLDLATVDRATYSPSNRMLVRTERPAAIVVLDSNQSVAQMREQLEALRIDTCLRIPVLAPEESVQLTSSVKTISSFLMRSAKSGKPPAFHHSQMVGQRLILVQLFMLQSSLPTFRCELATPRPR